MAKLIVLLLITALIAMTYGLLTYDNSLNTAPDSDGTGHVCIDSRHIECDGMCPCDGMECK
jgi:hypothetical protein